MGIVCSTCGHDNPTGLRVCARCASDLANICSACGFENPAGFKFCGQCGANLAAADIAQASGEELSRLKSYVPGHLVEKMIQQSQSLRGERRTVTVLFSDIRGFTTMSERLDPEDVYSIMDGLFREFVEEIYRLEGAVDKFTGDGLMALFGAPVTHENDPERAIRAAIAMQQVLQRFNDERAREYDVDLQLRVGLNTGEVVVGGLGSDLRLDYTAMGDTVNVAARLESAAEPGTILVSESVYQATEPVFEFIPMGDLSLKGRSAPVRTYRVGKEREKKGQARGVRGLEAPLVGRSLELQKIQRTLRECLRSSRGRIIFVTGEAGMGKSRLTAEWRAALPDDAAIVLTGTSFSHTASIGLWTFRDLLRGHFGLSESDAIETARGKLCARVGEILGGNAIDVLPYLQNLLSPDLVEPEYAHRVIHLTPAELRQQTFLAVRDLLVAESRIRPLIVILEDIHWIDRPSLDLVQFLLGAVEQEAIIFYCISRPDEGVAVAEIPDIARQQFPEQFTQIHLGPLSTQDVNDLVNALLTMPQFPPAFRDAIAERVEGNPFFLEEFVRMLIDRGVIERDADGQWRVTGSATGMQEVPRTLRGLILTRVDALDEVYRDVLQCAAVVGRSFPVRLLEQVVSMPAAIHRSLQHLEEYGLINAEPMRDDASYVFHHALTQEAVYGTLLKRRKLELHRSVGEAIERVYAERLDEQIEFLAHHYYLGDVPPRALEYLVLAGKRAAGRYANDEAQEHYTRAHGLLTRTEAPIDRHLDVLVGLADVASFQGEYDASLSYYDAGSELAAANSQFVPLHRLAEIERKAGRAWERKGGYEAASSRLQAVVSRLRESSGSEDQLERARAYNDLGWVAFRQGRMDEAESWTKRSLEEFTSTQSWQDVAAAYNRLAGISYQQGEWELAAEYALRGMKLREQIGFTYGLAMSYNNLSVIYMAGGDWDQGIRYAEKSLEMKERIGDVAGVGVSFNNLGMAYKDRGDLARAEEYLHRSLSTAKRIKNANLLASTLSNLGQVALVDGNWADAIAYLEESLAVASSSGSKDQMAETLCVLSSAWMQTGNLERAEQFLEQALALTAEISSRSALALTSRTLAILYRLQGKPAESLVELQKSVEQFVDLRNRLEIGKTYYQLGLTLARLECIEEAAGEMEKAIQIFDRLGASHDSMLAMEQLRKWSAA
jgi:class 3 adenylate cyclase/tetratricopeptide (TPR) repeat protein